MTLPRYAGSQQSISSRSKRRYQCSAAKANLDEECSRLTICCGDFRAEIDGLAAKRAILSDSQWDGNQWFIPVRTAQRLRLDQEALDCFVNLCEAMHISHVQMRYYPTKVVTKAGILAVLMRANGVMVLAKELIKDRQNRELPESLNQGDVKTETSQEDGNDL